MSFTVVPMHNLMLVAGTEIPFGSGSVLQDVPGWLKKEAMLNDLSRRDRMSTLYAKHALVAEYDASAIGEPDPLWKGKNPKSIQELKFDSVVLANIALWLMHPTTVCYTNGFHAISLTIPDLPEKQPILMQIQSQTPLFCHPNDANNKISVTQVVEAGELHAILATIPRKNPVWEALRASWVALTMRSADRRYPFF